MSTQPEDLIEDDDDSQDANLPDPARKRLRQLEKDNKRMAEQNAAYERREMIRRAGLDLNDDQIEALSATHKGESTPEALRATAERLKFAEPTPEVDPAERQAHQEIADARKDANVVGDTSYEDEVRTAKSAQQLREIAVKHGRPWAG